MSIVLEPPLVAPTEDLPPEVEESQTVRLLRAARELLSDRRRWTQDYPARTRAGTPCGSLDSDAYRFCAVGALYRVTDGQKSWLAAGDVLNRVVHESITSFNDRLCRTHEEVLAVFDRAIELAEKEAGMSTVLEPETTEAPDLEQIPVLPEKPEKVILEEVRELLSDKSRWIQGHYCLTADGHMPLGEVSFVHPTNRFCTIGAMQLSAVRHGWGGDELTNAANRLSKELGGGVIDVNDSPGGYEKIMTGLDRALARF